MHPSLLCGSSLIICGSTTHWYSLVLVLTLLLVLTMWLHYTYYGYTAGGDVGLHLTMWLYLLGLYPSWLPGTGGHVRPLRQPLGRARGAAVRHWPHRRAGKSGVRY